MRVLILSFAVAPNRTSELGVGWNISGEMARTHEVTVITRVRRKEVIEDWLRTHPALPQCGIRFLYYDLGWFFRTIVWRIPFGEQIYQAVWHRRIASVFRREIADADIVHHLTFGSPFYAPWAARVAKRMVWGPIGGANGFVSWKFLRRERLFDILRELLYYFISFVSLHPSRKVREIRNKCKAVIFRYSDLKGDLVMPQEQISDVICETSYEIGLAQKKYEGKPHPLQVICVGRLMVWKAVRYAVDGFARFLHEGGEGKLLICGQGALKEALMRQIRKLNLDDKVELRGLIPNEQVHKLLLESDVLLHPSFREGGSWSIFEGMAHGLPVICQDRTGMADVVAEGCGIRIAARSPEELIDGIAKGLSHYYQEPAAIQHDGEMARERIAVHYNKSVATEKLNRIYQAVMSRG